MSDFDVVFRGGTVIDGTGASGREVDVAVRGSTIVEIGPGLTGRRDIDCADLVVAPGFIDTHSHSDLRVFAEPELPMKLRQGITLEVLGQDGISVAPLRHKDRPDAQRLLAGLLGEFPDEDWRWGSVGDYLRALEDARPALNLAYVVPHGTLRTYVMGPDNRVPTDDELRAMQHELHRAIEEGALGLSTGLIYPPGCYSDTEELVALGEVLTSHDAPFLAHMRSESDLIEQALEEMITVGRQSGCPVHISHLKIAGRDNFSRAEAVVERIEAALARGVRVTGDQYPYAAGATIMGALLPPWVHDGGAAQALERLSDPELRRQIRVDMERKEPLDWDSFWKWTGPEGIVISNIASGRSPEFEGKTVAEAAAMEDKDPIDFVMDLLAREEMGVGMISHSQNEDVVERFVGRAFLNGSTDALLGGRPHPRAYGTYPRYLGVYVRERGTLPLTEMVRKLTSQAAHAMNLRGVGELKPGFAADVVVFDPATVKDTATYSEPARYPVGIVHVMVRGELAVENEEVTGRRAGRILRWTKEIP